jgi:CRP/FNR family transcriptional regulator, cyclic AMP receptor protein
MDPKEIKLAPLFAGLDRADLRTVALFADELDVQSGRVLVEEGRLAWEFFAIEEGTAEVTRGGQVIATLGPGDFFGEIGLLEGDRRTATVTATSPMKLIVLTGAQLRVIDKRMPEVAARIRQAVADRMAASGAKVPAG